MTSGDDDQGDDMRTDWNDRLPPPAFPPGADRRRRAAPVPGGTELPDPPFVSPDTPLPTRDMPAARSSDFDSIMGAAAAEDVVVTGIGANTHLTRDEGGHGRAEDPYISHLLDALKALTSAVGQKGEAGLRASPGMSRFEATLRGYCVGYLAGLRADDDRVSTRAED